MSDFEGLATGNQPEFVPHGNPIKRLGQHPIGFWFVFSGELAERASYYGMRTLLALYLVDVLGFSEGGGTTVMKAFMAACYLTPFIGGWIADRYLGRYKTILYYSIPYIVGHLVLGAFQNQTGLYIALALLAFGSGAIKPNTSVLMGQIYEAAGKNALLNEAFSLFYAAVNVGAFASSFALPMLQSHYKDRPDHGYGPALMVPAALMAVAFAFFAAGKKFYPQEKIGGPKVVKTPEQRELEKKTLLRIAGVFIAIAIFWLIYDQNADTWIYFANHHTDLRMFPPTRITEHRSLSGIMTANQMQAMNPLFIIVLTPIFNWIWSAAKRMRGGRDVADTHKMLVGFIIVIATSAIMVAAAALAGESTHVTIWWVILATFVITLAELCISPVGLEFAYKQAAPGTKGVVTAAFHLMVFIGDFIGLGLAPFYEKELKPTAYFGILAVMMTFTSIAFVPIAQRFIREEKARAATA